MSTVVGHPTHGTETDALPDVPTSVRFDHVERLCDERGMFEHADHISPRLEHGYCVDDNARLLVVASREVAGSIATTLGTLSLQFVLGAQGIDGRSRNRMDAAGSWTDQVGTDDCWGRSVWGLGVAAAEHPDVDIRRTARRGFDKAVRQRSRSSRTMAFAALGAAAVLEHDRAHGGARSLLAHASNVIGSASEPGWAWPERRLAYANATLADAVIAAGIALERPQDVERGLAMLTWLLARETAAGHLSVTPAAGAAPDDVVTPRFDQQPIEVAAMADACWRAHRLTGDARWYDGVMSAARWFTGSNDGGRQMYDEQSGGGYDGLQHDSVNLNQGAESTLAFVSTMQRARSLQPAS